MKKYGFLIVVCALVLLIALNSFYTVEEASALAEELTRRAVDAVAKYKGGEGLAALAEGLCYRRK